MRHVPSLSLALLVAGAPAASAVTHELEVAPRSAEVTFFLEATGHDVNGKFEVGECRVTFDDESGRASGLITLRAPSATTFHEKRDKTMHRKVLKSEAHPLVTFRPARFEGSLPESGSGEVTLLGEVTLVGGTHPLALPARVERTPGGIHFETKFDVPYVEWGLKNPSVIFLRVSKVVQVSVAGDGTLR